jgi:hypothetical protein
MVLVDYIGIFLHVAILLAYIGKSVNLYLLCLNYEQIKTTHINIMSK